MNKVISKTIKIKTEKLPPDINFIENEIKKAGLNPIRWAIVDVIKDELIISASGNIL